MAVELRALTADAFSLSFAELGKRLSSARSFARLDKVTLNASGPAEEMVVLLLGGFGVSDGILDVAPRDVGVLRAWVVGYFYKRMKR